MDISHRLRIGGDIQHRHGIYFTDVPIQMEARRCVVVRILLHIYCGSRPADLNEHAVLRDWQVWRTRHMQHVFVGARIATRHSLGSLCDARSDGSPRRKERRRSAETPTYRNPRELSLVDISLYIRNPNRFFNRVIFLWTIVSKLVHIMTNATMRQPSP